MGKLIYLWHNKFDISYAMSIVSQFMQASYEDHMETVNKTLRYLKATPSKGSRIRKIEKRCIEAYTNSDWADSIVDKKNPPLDIIPLCGPISLLGEVRSKGLWLEVTLKLGIGL